MTSYIPKQYILWVCSLEMVVQLNGGRARDSARPHRTLVGPFASLVNRPHVILNIIQSLKPPTTLGALEIASSRTTTNSASPYHMIFLFGVRAQMSA